MLLPISMVAEGFSPTLERRGSQWRCWADSDQRCSAQTRGWQRAGLPPPEPVPCRWTRCHECSECQRWRTCSVRSSSVLHSATPILQHSQWTGCSRVPSLALWRGLQQRTGETEREDLTMTSWFWFCCSIKQHEVTDGAGRSGSHQNIRVNRWVVPVSGLYALPMFVVTFLNTSVVSVLKGPWWVHCSLVKRAAENATWDLPAGTQTQCLQP